MHLFRPTCLTSNPKNIPLHSSSTNNLPILPCSYSIRLSPLSKSSSDCMSIQSCRAYGFASSPNVPLSSMVSSLSHSSRPNKAPITCACLFGCLTIDCKCLSIRSLAFVSVFGRLKVLNILALSHLSSAPSFSS